MVKAVEANTSQKWVVLYVKRWLKAPIQMPKGRLAQRERGTPRGSAVSPVLANLFMPQIPASPGVIGSADGPAQIPGMDCRHAPPPGQPPVGSGFG
jgi:hypothetical protein